MNPPTFFKLSLKTTNFHLPKKTSHHLSSVLPKSEVPNNQDGPGEGVNLINIEAIPSGRGKPHPRNGGKPRGVKRREAFTAVRLKQRLETDIFKKKTCWVKTQKNTGGVFLQGGKRHLAAHFWGGKFLSSGPWIPKMADSIGEMVKHQL